MSRRRREPPREIEWHFFSFPVAFGFAVGGLCALVLALFFPQGVFILFLFGTSFGLAHIVTNWFKRRTLDRRRDRTEEEERERRALAARAAAAQAGEAASPRRRRRRRGG
jgi:4-hydroxybenzoate polyprenyltransferase